MKNLRECGNLFVSVATASRRKTTAASRVYIRLMDDFADSTMSPVSSDDHADVRASTLGQLGAQVAHDFNNILAVALTSIEMAMRISDPVKANVFLGNALKVIGRGRMLTDRLAAA